MLQQADGVGVGTAAPRECTEFASVVEAALRDGNLDDWQIRETTLWCHVAPAGWESRSQGWKLHVSATINSARDVLSGALPVLLRARCGFKFARSTDVVRELNRTRTPRGGSGKFLSVYPNRDEDVPGLAAELDAATGGLAGPRILSDRQLRPGSLVHYRYGGFVIRREVSNDGDYRYVILDPDGRSYVDRRGAWFDPPPWVVSPFSATPSPDRARVPGDFVLGGRFAVTRAIRHSNRGGVYCATDITTNGEVILKEARPYVAVCPDGSDARDVLRWEAQVLDALASTGVTPHPVVLFEHGGHQFLAEEFLPGSLLRGWVEGGRSARGLDLPGRLVVARKLLDMLTTIHDAGVVAGDFNPNNVMVLPDGSLRLIDLELAVLPDRQPPQRDLTGTPGYSPPEQLWDGATSFAADRFSLGATLCFLFTGADPFLPDDEPRRRDLRERVRDWLAVAATLHPIPPDLQTLIVGLMDDDPAQRATLAQAAAALDEMVAAGATLTTGGLGAAAPETLGAAEWSATVDAIVTHLVATLDTTGERLWPASGFSAQTDPSIVQYGAAGVLGVLARYLELTGDDRVRETAQLAIGWLRERAGAARPPGLYFGQAGVVWSLLDAGRVLRDDETVETALRLARDLPTSYPNPDLTHGTAGLGTTFLRLWQVTGEPLWLRRAEASGEELLASAIEDATGVFWETPASFSSVMAGRRFYGFAHGTAGIGNFLLTLAREAGRSDCMDVATRCGDTLVRGAIIDGAGARWAKSPGEANEATHWCNGSSGVATFLVRLHAVTGDARLRRLTEQAARAIVDDSWSNSLGQCHGLVGNGELLLDAADLLRMPEMSQLAELCARRLLAKRVYANARPLFFDDYGTVTAEWASGVSGILAFLLRLRHGTPRLWMVEDAAR